MCVIRVLMMGARTKPPKPAPERTMPNASPLWALKWRGVSVMTGKYTAAAPIPYNSACVKYRCVNCTLTTSLGLILMWKGKPK